MAERDLKNLGEKQSVLEKPSRKNTEE